MNLSPSEIIKWIYYFKSLQSKLITLKVNKLMLLR